MSSEETLSLLLHPLRRKIYSIVCERPGSYFYQLVNSLDIPQGTLNWHIQRLTEKGWLKTTKFGGKRLYYPAQLRSEIATKIHSQLAQPTARKILRFVLNHSGCYQLEIAKDLGLHHDTVRYHLDRLKKVELVTTKRDGRTLRIYPGENSDALLTDSLNLISDSFVSWIWEKLVGGCLYPEIIEKTPTLLVMRISCPEGEDMEFRINLTDWDFMSFLEGSQE